MDLRINTQEISNMNKFSLIFSKLLIGNTFITYLVKYTY